MSRRRLKLGRVVNEIDVRGTKGETVLSVYRDHGVVPKSSRDDNFNKTPTDTSFYKLVRPDDFVVNKMKAWQGSVARSDHRGIVSGDYLVCRLTSRDVLPAYLHFLLRSQPLIHEYRKRSSGIRPSQWRLYWEDLRQIEIELPALPAQRAIAEFLDTETTRVDALVTKKRRMIGLLLERRWAVLDELATLGPSSASCDMTVLKRLASVFTDGDWIESPYITSTGIRLLQTGNIGRGYFRDQGGRYISEETFHALRCTEVLPGDVLISRLANTVGQACLAPDLGCRMVSSVDVVIMRPSGLVDPDYLVRYMSTERHLSSARLEARGTTMQRLARSQVGALPVPLPALSQQRDAVARVDSSSAPILRAVEQLKLQTELLQERRQALITAAVAGELEVPGVAA